MVGCLRAHSTLAEDPSSVHSTWCSQLQVRAALGDLTSSSGHHRCLHSCAYTHTLHTHTHTRLWQKLPSTEEPGVSLTALHTLHSSPTYQRPRHILFWFQFFSHFLKSRHSHEVMSVIVPDSQISMTFGLQRLGVQQSSIQMCIFICLLDSTKMSLPNQVRQRSSQFSGFSFTLRKINHSPDEYAESLRIIPESSSLNPCYILLSLFLPKLSSVCVSPLSSHPPRALIQCVIFNKQELLWCAKDHTYTVQAKQQWNKPEKKNRLPSHKVLQVEQWERHVNTSIPCDVI